MTTCAVVCANGGPRRLTALRVSILCSAKTTSHLAPWLLNSNFRVVPSLLSFAPGYKGAVKGCVSSLRSLFGSAMVFVRAKLFLPLLAALFTLAAPLDDVDSSGSSAALDGVTTMTTAQVNVFRPFTHYAAAGHCNSSVTITWTCGTNCDANPGFKPIASGGDGSIDQFCSWVFFSTLCQKPSSPLGLIRVCRL